ncbi:hypothetical protein RSOLAG1IB_11902 [Rhizoctonia solani AG-1 IB]|uniref:Uncharacterized protein n=1 Tax=Thanatephorus cucumeris (strain AG1-IB / isolate 7/3/14) TaxID=1108050 RepID=A0A0B7FE59_THACB|nr:hypothetical protein RSOLAG1IB_11902 [Rhizoctonia solani AG-1 IB]
MAPNTRRSHSHPNPLPTPQSSPTKSKSKRSQTPAAQSNDTNVDIEPSLSDNSRDNSPAGNQTPGDVLHNEVPEANQPDCDGEDASTTLSVWPSSPTLEGVLGTSSVPPETHMSLTEPTKSDESSALDASTPTTMNQADSDAGACYTNTVLQEGSSQLPHTPRIPYSRTLGAAIAATRAAGVARREKLLKSPIIKRSPPPGALDSSLTPLKGVTGSILLDSVLTNMEGSRFCLWPGNIKYILKHCEWIKNTVTNSFSLMWKKDSEMRPAGGTGVAMLGLVGMVSGELSTLQPDAGFTFTMDTYDGGLPGRKRYVALGRPDLAFFPLSFWERQAKGMTTLFDHARQSINTKTAIPMGGSFYDSENDCFKIRSPLFLPPALSVDNDNEDNYSEKNDSDEDDLELDLSDIPESHRFPTWDITVPRVSGVMKDLVSKGHQPQIMNAYDRFNTLIHPNYVHQTLNGTISYAYFTLEKQLYSSKKYAGGKGWFFNADLVKVQVLKKPAVPRSSLKRKRIHGYNANEAYRSSAGPSNPKRVKF